MGDQAIAPGVGDYMQVTEAEAALICMIRQTGRLARRGKALQARRRRDPDNDLVADAIQELGQQRLEAKVAVDRLVAQVAKEAAAS